MYRVVKEYYDLGFYNKENVKVFVKSNQISVEDYLKIVGEEYTE